MPVFQVRTPGQTPVAVNKDAFKLLLENASKQILIHKDIAKECNANEESKEMCDAILSYIDTLKNILSRSSLSVHYFTLFQNDLNQIVQLLPYRQYQNIQFLQGQNLQNIALNIERNISAIQQKVESAKFNVSFFEKLNFFDSNIVAIGANGSGKTTLANSLKQYLPSTGVVIGAQKILVLPTFDSIANVTKTNKELGEYQKLDKSLKTTYQSTYWFSAIDKPFHEFGVLINNLLADRNAKRNQFVDSLPNSGKTDINKPKTNLDKTLEIWNFLLQHKTLTCPDGVNLSVKDISTGKEYPAHALSDGEKEALFLIAQVLQAPKDGFVITDEPETFLHKTILKKLWDKLEQERADCIFLYLTHDLDFATSRITAKKVWIKSFSHPDKWNIEDIPDSNELPEPLLLELLGSRKSILFCEGMKGSLDEKIYSILFPNFTITPVESCFAVINHTKAFNKIPNTVAKAYGIIDADYHESSQLESLKSFGIFSYSLAEVDNLLLDESFLRLFSTHILSNEPMGNRTVEEIKNDALLSLSKEKELQISRYLSSKIDYYFNGQHLNTGDTKQDVETNFNTFCGQIDINKWYQERETILNSITDAKDYRQALLVYNNKGLKGIVEKHLGIKDFQNKAIDYLGQHPEAQKSLLDYFPQELKTIHGGNNAR